MITIDPYKSIGTLNFGVESEAVHMAFGEPVHVNRDRRGHTVLRYDGINVTVSNEGVVEVEFLPEIPIELSGIEIFSDPRAFKVLCEMDGDPQICFGAVILLNLGISMTGFHDRDESQKSVSVFAKGRFDELKQKMDGFLDQRGV